jgi:signal transduction histidine kinase
LAKRQELFISAVSHELNTPLASARLTLETMMRDPRFAGMERPLKRLWLSNLHLSQTVRTILDAQWVENPGKALDWSEINLFDMVNSIIRSLPKLMQDEDSRIDVAVSEEMQVHADYRAMQIVLSNLLCNALQHGGSPAAVRVEAGRERGRWWIAVEDNGQGIPLADRRRVFGRFYKGSGDRGSRATGTGLGLYLVKRLVRMLRGNIRVQEGSILNGARFVLTFKEARGCPTG